MPSKYRGARVPEADFQRQITDAACLLGWVFYHPWLSKFSQKGWPDIFLSRADGRLLALEVKGDGGRVSRQQQFWLDALCRGGVLAVAVYPEDSDWLLELLR